MKKSLLTSLILTMGLVGVAHAQSSYPKTYKHHNGKVVEVKAGILTKEGRELRRAQIADKEREAKLALASQYVPPKVYATQAPIVRVMPEVQTATVTTPTPIISLKDTPKPKLTAEEANAEAFALAQARDQVAAARQQEEADKQQAIKDLAARAKLRDQKLAKIARQQQKLREQQEARENQRDRLLLKKPDVRIGMTTKTVREGSKWGEPNYKNTRIDNNGKFEVWYYGGGAWLSFKNNKVTSINY